MQPQHPPTYEEVSSDDQAGKMPHRPAESSPVHQATPVLPQYSREYIQYLREKERHRYQLEQDSGCDQRLAKMCTFLLCMLMLLIFSLAYMYR
jgi:hypothetical protein